GTVRQLAIRGLGHDEPTILITNDYDKTTKVLIECYAGRMNIEQRLAEGIRSFHLDALSSAVNLNVDLDVVLSVLAGAVCAALRRRLPGYTNATPDTVQRRFLDTGGPLPPTTPPAKTAAPTHPSSARPTSPKPPASPGGGTGPSTLNSTSPNLVDQTRVELCNAKIGANGCGQPVCSFLWLGGLGPSSGTGASP